VSDLDPNFFDIQPFVRYDASGRLLEGGSQGLGFTHQALMKGEYIIPTQVDFSRNLPEMNKHYIDLSGSAPLVKERPVIDWSFDKNSVVPMQEATLVHLAPCVVNFSGPQSGKQDHPKLEDLKIGFKLPGVYELTFEAFPYMPAKFAIQVQPSGLATPIPNVNLNLSVST
jgi:hypothetical protein